MRGPVTSATARTACLLGAGAAVAFAVLPPLGGAMSFPRHIGAHLLLAMVAPLLFALAAPVTTVLGRLPGPSRRRVTHLLHSAPVRVLASAPVVVLLEVGGMYGYYLTPLYEASHHRPWLMALVHLHMFLAGWLFCAYVVGREPWPRRPSVPTSLAVLLVAGAAHGILAKLLYAHDLPHGADTVAGLHLGAELMYYGGDAVEVALAVAVLAGWYARTGRELRRRDRRAAAGAAAGQPSNRAGSPAPTRTTSG